MAFAAPTMNADRRWLFGPVSDLLFGCGLAYIGVFALLSFGLNTVEAVLPIWSFLIISLFISGPHYGATLLRVYERREDRRAYTIFTIYATAVIWAAFAVGVHNALVGSLMFTLYFTWSPWHYTGQNYGLAVMFLGRRGVKVSPLTKRLLYLSFIFSYGVIFVTLHGGGGTAGYTGVAADAGSYRFMPLGMPGQIAAALYWILTAAFVGTLGTAIVMLLRVAPLRDLTPTLVLVFSQALWFLIPALARSSGKLQDIAPLSLRHAEYAALWIVLAHSIQYLWVTTFYAARDEGVAGRTRYYGKALLAGSAIWGIPTLIFAPSALGNAPYDLGLFMVVAAAVNLHHFVLDGAIWKLRDSRIAKILVRTANHETNADFDTGRSRSFGKPIIWAMGVAGLIVLVGGDLETRYGVDVATERGDHERVELAAKRLAWVGRDGPLVHHNLALLAQMRGDLVTAENEFLESLDRYETKNAWYNLGSLRLRQGRNTEALEAYQAALRMNPYLLMSLIGASQASLSLGDPDGAVRYLERATALSPGDADLRQSLIRLRRIHGIR